MNGELPIRDVHLPDSMLWWPLAPGWWLLLSLGLFVALLAYQKTKKRNGSDRWKRTLRDAHRLMDELEKDTNNNQVVKEISLILRRTAMSLYGRGAVAGLAGKDWLTFLDAKGHSNDFTQGMGQLLGELPFRKNNSQTDRNALVKLAKQWLSAQESKSDRHV